MNKQELKDIDEAIGITASQIRFWERIPDRYDARMEEALSALREAEARIKHLQEELEEAPSKVERLKKHLLRLRDRKRRIESQPKLDKIAKLKARIAELESD